MKKQKVKSKKTNYKKTSGITLIALVVTIIVLLILAGISIQMLSGNNGIINRAISAKTQTDDATELEKIQLEVLGSFDTNGDITIANIRRNMQNLGGTVSGGGFPCTVELNGNKYTGDKNGKVELYKPVINPYKDKQWEKAWVCNNGVWEDTPIEYGNPAEGEVVAKLYKTGNLITPDSESAKQLLGEDKNFTEGNEYHLVFEGQGKMGSLIDENTGAFKAWQLSSSYGKLVAAETRYYDLINQGVESAEAETQFYEDKNQIQLTMN